jgi:D-alanine-D-alanine ligase
MNNQQKIRVAVLYGGRSGEHDISLKSAKNIIKHLDAEKFTAIPVGIDREGRWYFNDASVSNGPNLDALQVKNEASNSAIPHADPTQERHFDVIFPALHGKWGEDGTVQGLLELTNIPYVGCGVLSSAVCMDKDITKRLVKQLGVSVGDYVIGYAHEDLAGVLKKTQATLSLPVFIKPANAGSSDGVSKVDCWEDFSTAWQAAIAIDDKVLIEQALTVRDIEISVMQARDKGAPRVSAVAGEVINNKAGFYSKEAKFKADFFPTLQAPAEITDEQLNYMRLAAANIFTGLECAGLARIDFFIEKETGKVFFNEVNTMPGFTKMSLYPILWELSGLGFKDLLTELIEMAMQTHTAVLGG